ncbi:MAG: AIPR family protein [Acidimicrobiales bacterium]|nr:AIPR family protein [Acidimicrobiales bacterium]MYG87742.1 AIPR family protein [Acidimicrobiales bacterium]MYI29025.1 AIPR family protein [Acidimicrobiales bacterium]
MPIDMDEFHKEMFQDIHGRADAEGMLTEDTFFEVFTEPLIDAGELETADRVYYTAPRGIRVDGYGGDPLTTDGVLSLIVSDFRQSSDHSTLTATEMNAAFRRLLNFIDRCLREDFRNALEESSPAFGLADLIGTRWESINRIRLILISNRVLSSRVDGREAGELRDTPVSYSVWDLGRIHRFVASGREREDIIVDLEEYGEPLLILPAHIDAADYKAYLAVIPGAQLARIYERWGARLLEQNVRVFLQARGKVNRGIRTTIEHNPNMFFAYNNGITATAESIQTAVGPEGLMLTSMRNFQIVNGGQTTASIHAALRNPNADLDDVFVQMKLSIVDHEVAQTVVPKISEYANSQNRVSAADFFSNHPFHIRMEEFSRRLYAPSPDGQFRESKWFYERARGQYQDQRARGTAKERRMFEAQYPRKQLHTKTDLAKYMNVWRCKPEIVSRGAQKNFADFAAFVGAEWNRNPDGFNEAYYREAIAKAIIFKTVERIVTEQPWYQGGYRANVVAYAIAKLAHDLEQRERSLDFQHIWRAQSVSEGLGNALTVAAATVHDVIVDPPASHRNVTEWAKQQACWNRVERLRVKWPASLEQELLTDEEVVSNKRAAAKDQRELNGIEAQTAVVNAGAEFWKSLRQWGVDEGMLSPTDAGVLDVASAVPAKLPSEKQSLRTMRILKRLQDAGCQLSTEAV